MSKLRKRPVIQAKALQHDKATPIPYIELEDVGSKDPPEIKC